MNGEQLESGDYVWSGEPSDLATSFSELAASQVFEPALGRSYSVPSTSDYEAALHESGELAPGHQLVDHPELMGPVQAHWHAGGYNACLFASHLSERRAEHGWVTVVVADRGAPGDDAKAIDDLVIPRVEDPEVEVISVLLPGVAAAEGFTDTVWCLSALPRWRLRDEGIETNAEAVELHRLGIDVDVDLDHWSEVLGFGPFPPMAYTRLAPFCELAIRAKPPARRRRDSSSSASSGSRAMKRRG